MSSRPGEENVASVIPMRPLGTRAVLRRIEAGNPHVCTHCELPVKFDSTVPSKHRFQVICNVYDGPRWDRLEAFHVKCYENAGSPHGQASG